MKQKHLNVVSPIVSPAGRWLHRWPVPAGFPWGAGHRRRLWRPPNVGEKKVVKNSKKLDSVKDLRRNPMVISAKFLQFLKKKVWRNTILPSGASRAKLSYRYQKSGFTKGQHKNTNKIVAAIGEWMKADPLVRGRAGSGRELVLLFLDLVVDFVGFSYRWRCHFQILLEKQEPVPFPCHHTLLRMRHFMVFQNYYCIYFKGLDTRNSSPHIIQETTNIKE